MLGRSDEIALEVSEQTFLTRHDGRRFFRRSVGVARALSFSSLAVPQRGCIFLLWLCLSSESNFHSGFYPRRRRAVFLKSVRPGNRREVG